jgi:hypothetical protein
MTSRIAVVVVLGPTILGTTTGLAGCSNPVAANTPVCDKITSALILSAQAIPGTAYVPCINSLKTDWSYDDLQAQSGRSEFGLSSMSLGMSSPTTDFLRVTLLPSCDTKGATRVASDEPGVPLFVDVHSDAEVAVVIVPDGDGSELSRYADALRGDLAGTVLADRKLDVRVDTSAAPVSQRIEAAHNAGASVLVVTTRDTEQQTVTLILPGKDTERSGLARAEITDTLRAVIKPATYTGSWYYPFAHGCVIYRFDAQGSGVATLEADVKAALGLHDAEAMREQARAEGYDVR